MTFELTEPEALLLRFQSGDERALDDLCAHYLPRLKRWARARLTWDRRDGMTTDDLIQEAFVRSLVRLRTFRPRVANGLFRYLCTTVLNQVRDHARQLARRPRCDVADLETRADPGASPLEQAIMRQVRDRYERGLTHLAKEERQLITAFVDLRFTDRQLAERFKKPSPDAARMARNRALAHLAETMEASR
jgi:RNA polymerase sigma factor (sigma-70 family)